jgi:hypothetical protein
MSDRERPPIASIMGTMWAHGPCLFDSARLATACLRGSRGASVRVGLRLKRLADRSAFGAWLDGRQHGGWAPLSLAR